MGLIVATQSIASLGGSVIGPLGPFIHSDWGLSRAEIGLLQSGIFLGVAFLSILAGWLVDLFGVRRMLLIGLGLMGFFMTGVHWVQGLSTMVPLLLLAGFSYAVTGPLTTKAIMNWFTYEFRATAMSIKQMGVTFGQSLAALILPTLAVWVGWRTSISIVGAGIITTALVIFCLYKEKRGGEKSAVAGLPGWRELLRLTVSHQDLLPIYIISSIYSGVQTTFAVYLPLYGTQVFNLSAVEAGGLLAVMLISGTVGRPLWGLLSDLGWGGSRMRILYYLGFAASIFGFSLTFLGAGAKMPLVYLVVAAIGITLAAWNGLYMVTVAEIAGERRTGFLIGVSTSICNLGMIVLPPAFGWMVDVTGSYTIAFRWLVLFPAMAAVAAYITRRIWTESQNQTLQLGKGGS